MNGCINDVDLGRILSTDTTVEEIQNATAFFCNDQMRATLDRLQDIAPQAPIVVTGYFPFVSSKSDFSSLLSWAQTQGFDVANVTELAEIAGAFANHSEIFYEASTVALQSAITDAASRRANPMDISYVDPAIRTGKRSIHR